jgi:hypothetical protein
MFMFDERCRADGRIDAPALHAPIVGVADLERAVREIKRSMKRPVDDDFPDAGTSMRESRSEAPQVFARRVAPQSRSMSEEQRLEAEEAQLFEPPASPSASQKMLDLQGSMARGRSSLSHLLHSIGFGKHRPEWKETASIDLTPWCTVTFDAEQLRRLPHAAFEPLGEALAQSLREHRLATRRERK